jgi:hypothetical protein
VVACHVVSAHLPPVIAGRWLPTYGAYSPWHCGSRIAPSATFQCNSSKWQFLGRRLDFCAFSEVVVHLPAGPVFMAC